MRNLTGQSSIVKADDESNLALYVGALVEVVGMNRFASRKFLLALLTQAANVWLCAAGLIADGVYSAVTIAVVGVYVTGNVAQKTLSKDVP